MTDLYMVECHTCGSIISEYEDYCLICGTNKLEALNIVAEKALNNRLIVCPHCKGIISDSDDICRHCGAKRFYWSKDLMGIKK